MRFKTVGYEKKLIFEDAIIILFKPEGWNKIHFEPGGCHSNVFLPGGYSNNIFSNL